MKSLHMIDFTYRQVMFLLLSMGIRNSGPINLKLKYHV